MQIITCTTGALAENCYIIADGDIACIIDPGDDAEDIIDIIKEKDLNVKYILLTHGHFDHIGAVSAVREFTGASVCIHKDDDFMLTDSMKNLSAYMGESCSMKGADVLLRDGSIVEFGTKKIKVVHTPGHTPGGVCYIVDDVMFSGDTLFFMSIGRSDFPYSDPHALDVSLNVVIKNIAGDLTVYPGHGEATSLEFEKQNNPYMR